MHKHGQIVRIIVMFVVMVNSVLLINDINFLPYTDDQIAAGISSVALVISEIYNHYKNNDYSVEAEEATEYMHELKRKKRGINNE